MVLMNCIIVHIETDHEKFTLKNWKLNPCAKILSVVLKECFLCDTISVGENYECRF